MYRVTIRATDESVPPVLIKVMEEKLSQGTDPSSDNVNGH